MFCHIWAQRLATALSLGRRPADLGRSLSQIGLVEWSERAEGETSSIGEHMASLNLRG